MVVIHGEPFLKILWQFALRVKLRPALVGAGLLPWVLGCWWPVYVEHLHGLAGQEETVLAAFRHAPHHRGHPAAGA